MLGSSIYGASKLTEATLPRNSPFSLLEDYPFKGTCLFLQVSNSDREVSDVPFVFVPQTDTGRRLENRKARELTLVKELGKIAS